METPAHPVFTWMSKNDHDVAWLQKELRKAGLEYEESYLTQVVVNGYYPPGRKLQNALVAICGVPVAKIIGFPYKSERAA